MDATNPILSARKTMKMTQTEMAVALGVTISTVWRWEKEQAPISDRTLRAVEMLLAGRENAASSQPQQVAS